MQPDRSTQRDKVLDALRRAGSRGVTNVQLNATCFRYGARIFDLRKMGYDIKTESEGGGLFRSTLVSEPENAKKPHNHGGARQSAACQTEMFA